MYPKTRSSSYESWSKYHYRQGIDPPLSSRVDYSFPKVHEYLAAQNGRGFTNPCFHYKHRLSYYTYSVSGESPPNGGAVTTYDREWFPTWRSGRIIDDIPFHGFSFNEFQKEALLLPDLNLLNFFREAPDLKDLLKRPEGGIGATYLTYSFGWEPLVKELSDLYNTVKTLKERFDRVTHQPVNTKIFLGPIGKPYVFTRPFSGHFSSFELRFEGRITHRASCLASVSLRKGSNPYTELLYYLDVLGLGKVLSTIWESIPFSFVVDWYIKIGDFLAQYDPLLSVGSFDIKLWDFCRSAKLSGNVTLKCVDDQMFTSKTLVNRKFLDGEVTLYKREPFIAGNPLTIDFGTGAFSSAKRAANAAALAATFIDL